MDGQQFEKRMESLINYYKSNLTQESATQEIQICKIEEVPTSKVKLEKPQKECLEYQKLLSRQKSKKMF